MIQKHKMKKIFGSPNKCWKRGPGGCREDQINRNQAPEWKI